MPDWNIRGAQPGGCRQERGRALFSPVLPGLAFLLLASPAVAQALRSPPGQYVVACHAPFARTASHADLVKLYGTRNITFETVNREGGEVVKATVLFSKDPSRRLEIEWHDSRKRRRPSMITVFGENNRWTGPLGIRNGMTIQEIEARAGRPFKINGFGFDVAGAGHFAETTLERLPGDCMFGGYFDIEGGLPPEHLQHFIGEVEIDSNDPDLLTLSPRLWMYTLTYPLPGAE